MLSVYLWQQYRIAGNFLGNHGMHIYVCIVHNISPSTVTNFLSFQLTVGLYVPDLFMEGSLEAWEITMCKYFWNLKGVLYF